MHAFALAATIGAASALSVVELKYMNHLAEFGKNMASIEEFNTRMVYFATLDQYIEDHNAEGHSYTLGHNQFSDWSRTEYTGMLGYKSETVEKEFAIFDESNNSTGVNWVTAGAVTPVKDQGQCGSCWSFSATGALEGEHFVQTGTLESFSEQQLVSCSTANYACNGGW